MKRTKTILAVAIFTLNYQAVASAALPIDHSSIFPIMKYDPILSDYGPELIPFSPVPLHPQHQLGIDVPLTPTVISYILNKYTYVRCYYNVNTNEKIDITTTQPLTNYVWALNEQRGYYKLKGYWRNPSEFSIISNMFYTKVRLSQIQEICDKTLSLNSETKDKHSFYQVAANNKYSFNYVIWQNDYVDRTNRDFNKLNKIVVFGDSLSDINNVYNKSNWIIPNNKTWYQGRFTNGLTWVEYLSMKMNIPFYNFAYGGSEINKDLWLTPSFNAAVEDWITHKKFTHNYEPKYTLFTVLIGNNDLLRERNPDGILKGIKNAIIKLYKHGARNVLLLNLPDVTKAPLFTYGINKNSHDVHFNIVYYNQQLALLVEDLHREYPSLQITLYDTYAKFNDLFENPSNYGLTNLSDSCLLIDEYNIQVYAKQVEPRPICINASEFMFWDLIHPTTAVHKILAESVYEALESAVKPFPPMGG
jgi:thermolabile hemolysin